ncbi:MAG: cytochrome P460 family protein [Bryobacteraceae bacterium]|nr:cytochrome P460 family protein [Bryobacteraceae bacterium]
MGCVLALILVAGLAFAGDKARFTADGALIRPSNYREWIFLSSGLGMTYGPNAPASGAPLRFDNVFVNPSSYQAFRRTGRWPDGTVLVLEVRESQSRGSINERGHYQTSIAAIEANVKDSRRFPNGGWAFFDLTPRGEDSPKAVSAVPPGNNCEKCHSTNGAVDNTFVQFYPELIPFAQKFGTYKPGATAPEAQH